MKLVISADAVAATAAVDMAVDMGDHPRVHVRTGTVGAVALASPIKLHIKLHGLPAKPIHPPRHSLIGVVPANIAVSMGVSIASE